MAILIDWYQFFRFNADIKLILFFKLSAYQQGTLMTTKEAESQPVKTGMNAYDMAFVALMAGLMVFVFWLTTVNYQEGMKTEVAKRNGEAWVEWLTTAGTARFNGDFEHAPCSGKAEPGTWGECAAYIKTQTGLKSLVNTFFDKPPELIAACNKDDRSTTGAVVIENLIATPAGSAIPVVVKPLADEDLITAKLQLRITVCDKGGYPIKISEFEF